MKLKTFTIITRKWARGGTNGKSALRNEIGCECCLGFLANACGIERLENAPFPADLTSSLWMKRPYAPSVILKKLKGLATGVRKLRNTALCSLIAKVNDNDNITDEQRKQKLAPLFAKNRVETSLQVILSCNRNNL